VRGDRGHGWINIAAVAGDAETHHANEIFKVAIANAGAQSIVMLVEYTVPTGVGNASWQAPVGESLTIRMTYSTEISCLFDCLSPRAEIQLRFHSGVPCRNPCRNPCSAP
jgi:hypothetical protein